MRARLLSEVRRRSLMLLRVVVIVTSGLRKRRDTEKARYLLPQGAGPLLPPQDDTAQNIDHAGTMDVDTDAQTENPQPEESAPARPRVTLWVTFKTT